MKDSIFEHLEYRIIIKKIAKFEKISYKKLSEISFMHSSYFSRVISGDADFSSDQLFSIGTALGLTDSKLNYFLLLGENARCANQKRKLYLSKKIKELRQKERMVITKLKNVVELTKRDVSDYYEEAITAKIHMYLTMEKYRNNRNLILKKIGIKETKLLSELKKLQSLNIISITENKIILNKQSVHLDEKNPISKKNHINWRLESIASLLKSDNSDNSYHLSATFSSNSETKEKIRELFKDFVVKSQKLVSKSKDVDEVYHIGFDLY